MSASRQAKRPGSARLRRVSLAAVAVAVTIAAVLAGILGSAKAPSASGHPAGGGSVSGSSRLTTIRHDDASADRAPVVASGARPAGRMGVARVRAGEPRFSPRVTSNGLVPILPVAPAGWTITASRIEVGGLDRYYLVARPQHITVKSLPLLVVLHGRYLTPAAMEAISGFLPVVGQAVVIYPAGYDESWNAGDCCGMAATLGIHDVAFVEAAIHQALNDIPQTSSHRVYLVGYSNGGRLVYRMACEDPGAFAGVASVEAVPMTTCPSTHPVPLVAVASTGDPLLSIGSHPKYMAGRVEPTVAAVIARWRELERCTPAGTTAVEGRLITATWSSCAPPGRVELAVYRGGSHAWPQALGGAPSAQQLIWAAFQQRPSSAGLLSVPTSVESRGGVG